MRYTFQGNLVRDLPITVAATLPVLSKAYYSTHDFEKTTLDRPLGSGPYKVGDFKRGDVRLLSSAATTTGRRTCR